MGRPIGEVYSISEGGDCRGHPIILLKLTMLWPRTGVDDDVLCCFNVDWAYVPAARSGPEGYVHMVCTKLSYEYCIAVLDLNVCSSTRIFVRIQK